MSSMGVMKPDLIMKSIIPVVMAGVLGIYGLIIAVIIANQGARFSPDPSSCEAPPPPPPPPPLPPPPAPAPNSSTRAAVDQRLRCTVVAQLHCP